MAGVQKDLADLSINESKGLDDARRKSIKVALEAYKNTVLEHNLSNLRMLIDDFESLPQAQRDAMHRYEQQHRSMACMGIERFAATPRGLLDPAVRTRLVEKYYLDGVYHLREDFPQDRDAWYAVIRGFLQEGAPTAGAFPPSDLEYLCTLVDGICGSGLPEHVFLQQYNMLDIAERSRNRDRNRISVGESSLPADWYLEHGDIELSVKIGCNEEHSWGGSYLLWCRRSANDPWQWRYAAHADEWVSDIYDTLEEYLVFYAHFNEQNEARARGELRAFGIAC